ncbi:hypothetical protein P8452_61114 [Trifolium repens]|nr:hypothetical protein P8452_61114 [Trifolium repens]
MCQAPRSLLCRCLTRNGFVTTVHADIKETTKLHKVDVVATTVHANLRTLNVNQLRVTKFCWMHHAQDFVFF